MDPLTPIDTLCRIILRAREFEAQTASDYDPGEAADNVDDEQEGMLSVLDDDINTSVEEELKAAFEDLGEDQLAEVVAFCWVGQGTYDASDWDEATEEAQSLVDQRRPCCARRADGHADACLRAWTPGSLRSTSAAKASASSPETGLPLALSPPLPCARGRGSPDAFSRNSESPHKLGCPAPRCRDLCGAAPGRHP